MLMSSTKTSQVIEEKPKRALNAILKSMNDYRNNVIGAHGAALTNLVFCKQKTKIIELKPFRHPGKYYQRISKINNLLYYSIESQKKYLKNKNGDIFVDLKELDKKINA